VKNLNFKKRSEAIVDSIRRTFERHGGRRSKWAEPQFDAIAIVLGEHRDLFDTEGFLKRYPSVRRIVNTLREKINLRIQPL